MANRKRKSNNDHERSGRASAEAGAEASRKPFRVRDFAQVARPRPDHRRLRRRSLRDRHLQPGRRAARLRHRLDHAADLSADGGDPGNFRPRRPRHRARHFRQCLPALSAWLLNVVVALLFIANTINIAADLGAMADATKLLIGGPRHRLCGGVRRDLGRGADLPRLPALCRGAEMADAQPVRLCRRARLRARFRGARRWPASCAADDAGARTISRPSSRSSAPRSRPICSSGRPRRRPKTSASMPRNGR